VSLAIAMKLFEYPKFNPERSSNHLDRGTSKYVRGFDRAIRMSEKALKTKFPDATKRMLLEMRLEGAAQSWAITHDDELEELTYDEFMEALKRETVGKRNRFDQLRALAETRREEDETVKNYANRLKDLALVLSDDIDDNLDVVMSTFVTYAVPGKEDHLKTLKASEGGTPTEKFASVVLCAEELVKEEARKNKRVATAAVAAGETLAEHGRKKN
jgi:hypothetical protein